MRSSLINASPVFLALAVCGCGAPSNFSLAAARTPDGDASAELVTPDASDADAAPDASDADASDASDASDPFTRCESMTACGACLATTDSMGRGCGWCELTRRCLYGTMLSPLRESCLEGWRGTGNVCR